MTNEQAEFLRDFLIQSQEFELPITAKVIAAIPEGKMSYKADEKARTSGEIAWHMAVSDKLFLEGILAGEFNFEEGPMPAASSGKPIADWYTETIPSLMAKVKAMDGASLAKTINFFGVFNLPAAAYLNFMLAHTIHHRGQLAAGLRSMGGKVPSIYGGSFDEPFNPPA
jgi:uncharacterized damage-inducible protein DinB